MIELVHIGHIMTQGTISISQPKFLLTIHNFAKDLKFLKNYEQH